MKAIGYIRVSTEDQAKEGISLDNQRKRIEDYCKYKGFELLEIIEDAGISGGKNKARPGFVKLLEKIESRDIDAIVLYSLERLSRDMLTLLTFERLVDEQDIQFHTVEGSIDTSTPDGWLNFAMKAFLGEMERRQTKYRTKKAMEFKRLHGAVVGSVPYGYQREGDKLIPDLNEQTVIKLVNTLYAQGGRLADICKTLAEKGIKTRSGKNFTPEQVKRIIGNYRGKFRKVNAHFAKGVKTFLLGIA